MISFLIVAAVVGGVVYVEWPTQNTPHAQPSPQVTQATSTAQAPTTATSSLINAAPQLAVGTPIVEAQSGVASANPATIVVNEPSDVTVTTQITDARLIPGSVNLQRLDANGKVTAVLGNLNDTGTNGDVTAGDKTFTIRKSLTEATTTPVQLRVSWGLRGVLKRVVSNVVTVVVWQHVTEAVSGISFTVPPNLVSKQGENKISFANPSNPALPALFVAHTFDTPTELTTLPLEEALEEIAKSRLEEGDIIRIVNFSNGGMEVEARTFARHHFFLYNPFAHKAVEFMSGQSDFFTSETFSEIVRLTEFN